MKITRFALHRSAFCCPDSDGTFTVVSTFSPSRRRPGPIPAMDTGRSLSSGRASRGPVGRCGEVFGVNIDPLSFDEPRPLGCTTDRCGCGIAMPGKRA